MTEEITYFERYNKTDLPFYVTVSESLRRIKEGKIKEVIEKIRAEQDPDKRKKLKENLPCICFSGKFKRRKDNEQLTHSGLAIFDFDHVDVMKVKSALMALPFVFCAFISPSGDGVKALVKIPPDIHSHREHYLGAYEELSKIGALDITSQNPSRICFESYDPEIYINENADIFLKKVEVKTTPIPQAKAIYTDYSKVNPALAMIRKAVDGEKHAMLLKAAKLMGGYVSGGYVQEDEAERLLMNEITAREIDDPKAALKTIRDGISYGKLMPIRDDKIVLSDNSYDFVSTIDDEKYYMDSVRSGTLPMGLLTGIPDLDKHFRFKPGNLVIINGHDNVGKSSFLWYLAVKSSILHNWKWIMFCAENSEGQVRKNLIQFKTEKAIIHLNDREYQDALSWVYGHFTLIKAGELYSCEQVLEMGEKLFRKKTYNGFLIDPYNALDINIKDTSLSSHEYHYKVTAELRAFCKRFGVSIFLNCHAVTEALRRMHKDGEYAGYTMAPNKADTEGGGKFANRADDFITIHRHTQHPQEFNITQIHVRKIKETETGGMPTLRDEPVKLKMQKGKFGFYPLTEMLPLPSNYENRLINESRYQKEDEPETYPF